jgi:signal transduction histidine kinase/DNA-binding response OmpR family regulator
VSSQSSGCRAANLPPARAALLVVDCEEDRTARLAGALRARAYGVAVARDLQAALTAATATAPSAAIVGHVAGTDSLEVARRLHDAGVARVVVLAARPGDAPWPSVSGGIEFLDDTVSPDSLGEHLDRHLSAARPASPASDWIADAIARPNGESVADSGGAASPDPGLFDALDDGVALVDAGGRIVWSNSAFGRLFGIAAAFARGQALATWLPTRGTPLPGDNPQRDTPWLTTSGRRSDGTEVAVDVRLRLVAGASRQALVTVRDAGPRQLIEQTLRANSDLSEQLRRSQKIGALGRLAGGVAHDFNNLLQVIGGYAETLGVDRLDRESRRRVLDSIQNATNRASSLTRQLLAFGRRQVLVPQVLDLNATVRSLEHMLTRVIGEDITLVSHLSADLHHVKVDPGQIEQVVLNLAINARDAMLDGGTLEIHTENVAVDANYAPRGLPVAVPHGPWVHLVVRDTGSGMDPDTVAQAFEPFFTTKDVSRGSGLGLSMVYGIVKQSDGYTWIESAPGAGTTVHVLLPGVDGAVENRQADHAPSTAANGVVTGTVLIVEDDPEVRALFAAFLRHAGYDVLEAADGREALDVFERRAEPVDLVVTDVVMPNVSGPALAGALRARCPDVKLLFVSGYNEQTAGPAAESGTVHLPKPVTRAVLLRQVAALLASARTA